MHLLTCKRVAYPKLLYAVEWGERHTDQSKLTKTLQVLLEVIIDGHFPVAVVVSWHFES